ncbi:MAG: YkgJ family cysteine cluster protein [Methanolinea sp.]|nr:YkgJ family cysteine cluster protein [Methanolinea sp.]
MTGKGDDPPGWQERASAVCGGCGGRCCHEARPPLTTRRVTILLRRGVAEGDIEYAGYSRIRAREDGMCALWEAGRCRVHDVKPETCRAGPFTFDVEGGTVRVFLKHESRCPLVSLLKSDPDMFRAQFRIAVENILSLAGALPPGELATISAIPEPDCDFVAGFPLRPRGRGGP